MKQGHKEIFTFYTDEWKEVKLGDFANSYSGLSGKNKDDFGTGKPYISYMNVFSNSIINNDIYDLVSISDHENQNKVQYGDILFTVSSETPTEAGMVSVYLNESSEDVYLNSFCFGVRLQTLDILNPRFASFLLRFDDFRKEVFKLAQGSTRYNISKSGILNIKFKIPTLEEQKAIANCLSTWDEAIEKQQKLIEAKEIRHKALMQKLLSGKKRLPGFTDEWKEVKIKHLGEIKTGNTPSKNNSDYWGDEFYWCTADDMKNKYIYHTKQRLSSLGKEKARIVPENSILVTCIASIGINAITKVKTGFNQQINSITPNNNFDVEFIYYLINNNKSKLLEYAGAGALPMLNKNTFMEIAFKIPELNEQLAISNILKTSEAEIEIEKKKIDLLKEQKKALMQKLLTGKVRLPLQN